MIVRIIGANNRMSQNPVFVCKIINISFSRYTFLRIIQSQNCISKVKLYGNISCLFHQLMITFCLRADNRNNLYSRTTYNSMTKSI